MADGVVEVKVVGGRIIDTSALIFSCVWTTTARRNSAAAAAAAASQQANQYGKETQIQGGQGQGEQS